MLLMLLMMMLMLMMLLMMMAGVRSFHPSLLHLMRQLRRSGDERGSGPAVMARVLGTPSGAPPVPNPGLVHPHPLFSPCNII